MGQGFDTGGETNLEPKYRRIIFIHNRLNQSLRSDSGEGLTGGATQAARPRSDKEAVDSMAGESPLPYG